MPLPFTTTPIQLLHEGTGFYQSHISLWGVGGILAVLVVYIIITVIVLIGTLLFGRRWQCSTICLFNGFAAEIFNKATPLIGKRKKLRDNKKKMFMTLRWIFFVIAVFFTIWWILFLFGIKVPGDFSYISQIEIYKYLIFDLLMMMFFWIAFLGRGYCYYCPLGTFLSSISKIAGQKIKTDNSQCIQCGKCDEVCMMNIDIKDMAKNKVPVVDLSCVGCGHCIDECPTKTLSYYTKFIDKLSRRT